jgi:cytochrome c
MPPTADGSTGIVLRFGRAALALAAFGLIIAAAFQASPQQSPPPGGDSARGARLYERVCAACHSLDANRVGPMHRGLVGRAAASVEGFRYSEALSAQSFVWDETALNKWLENPPGMVPGTSMGIRVRLAEDRADIIAYLRQEAGQLAP